MAINNYPSALGTGMARLIKKWRAETRNKNVPSPEPNAIKGYLQKAERHGIPPVHMARIVLACEWVFRVRRITEEDIEQILAEMEDGFHKHENPVMSRFQAHLMIKAVEPQLRKQIIRHMPVVPLVFEPTITDPNAWFSMFSDHLPSPRNRTAPTSLLRDRSGRIPMPGPRVAGVMVEALVEQTKPRGSASLGTALGTLLLGREVQSWEFKDWRDKISALMGPRQDPPLDLRTWLGKQAKFAFDQSLLSSEAESPDDFLTRCEFNPPSVFFWLKNEEVFRRVLLTKWTSGFKNLSKTGRNSR